MLAWMFYSTLVATLASAAAALAEPFARERRMPCRAVWSLAMVVSFGLCGWAVRSTASDAHVPFTSYAASAAVAIVATATPGAGTTSDASGTMPVVARPMRAPEWLENRRANLFIAILWAAASALALGRLARSARQLRRARRAWTCELLCGESVLVSNDVGPAVIGIMRPRIVVPRWVTLLDAESQRLILAHEREHVRATDPLLARCTMLLVRLMPWNLPLWFVERRLRHAIEEDCDARVLRGAFDRRRYCALLLEVGERSVAAASPVLALAEPVTGLERRISAMTTGRKLTRRALIGAAAAVLLVAAACEVARPRVSPFSALAAAPYEPDVSTEAARAATSVPPTVESAWVSSAAPLDVVLPPSGGSRMVPDTLDMPRTDSGRVARLEAIADSIVRTRHPEVIYRPSGTPAFLGLVLDEHDRVLRHAVSLDTTLPHELAPALLAMGLDTVSERTKEVGMAAHPRWNLTVGHVVEAAGAPHGHAQMRAWWVRDSSSAPLRPGLLQRLADSVARARTPEAFAPHDGTFAIAVLLDSAGGVRHYAVRALPDGDTLALKREMAQFLASELGDSSTKLKSAGESFQVIAPKRTIFWAVPR